MFCSSSQSCNKQKSTIQQQHSPLPLLFGASAMNNKDVLSFALILPTTPKDCLYRNPPSTSGAAQITDHGNNKALSIFNTKTSSHPRLIKVKLRAIGPTPSIGVFHSFPQHDERTMLLCLLFGSMDWNICLGSMRNLALCHRQRRCRLAMLSRWSMC